MNSGERQTTCPGRPRLYSPLSSAQQHPAKPRRGVGVGGFSGDTRTPWPCQSRGEQWGVSEAAFVWSCKRTRAEAGVRRQTLLSQTLLRKRVKQCHSSMLCLGKYATCVGIGELLF